MQEELATIAATVQYGATENALGHIGLLGWRQTMRTFLKVCTSCIAAITLAALIPITLVSVLVAITCVIALGKVASFLPCES